MGIYLDSGLYLPDIGESEATWPPLMNANLELLDVELVAMAKKVALTGAAGAHTELRIADFDNGSDLTGDGRSLGTAYKTLTTALADLPSITDNANIPYKGGTVLFLGSHTITSGLVLPPGVAVEGFGQAKSRIIPNGVFDAITFSRGAGETYNQFASLRHCRIQTGTGLTGSYIKGTDLNGFSMQNVDMYGAPTVSSLWLNGVIGSQFSNVRIQGNTVAPGLLLDHTGSVAGTNNSLAFINARIRSNLIGLLARALVGDVAPLGGETVFHAGIIESNTDIGVSLAGVGPFIFVGTHFEGNTNYHIQTAIGANSLPVIGLHCLRTSFSNWRINLDGDRNTRIEVGRGPVAAFGTSGAITVTPNSIAPVIDIADTSQLNSKLRFQGAGVPFIVQKKGFQALPYSATIATNSYLGDHCFIEATNGTAFTISNPVNWVTDAAGTEILPKGWELVYDIKNSSGGAMGAITWGAQFILAGAFVNPANGKRRTIRFYSDGTNWVEVNRSAADI